MSQHFSYDVYVKNGVDSLGRDEFIPVAHFVARANAVALKRWLEARGETVRVERSTVYGLSEAAKEDLFSDYSQVPEYEPLQAHAPPAELGPSWEAPRAPESAGERQEREEPRPATGDPREEGADRPRDTAEFPVRGRHIRPWWRRMFGG